jgi:hypothetical protein
MELKLLRACFDETTVAQLMLNNKILCIYIGLNKKRGWSPVVSLPDGRYSLRQPRNADEQWNLQLTTSQSRKPLLMNLHNLTQEELTGYDDAPIYLSLGKGKDQISEPAKQAIARVAAAIQAGEKVYITIRSEYIV